MRGRWILWVLSVGFVWFVLVRLTEIEKLIATLAHGQWQWVLAAALLQVLYYTAYTGIFRCAFHTVEVESRLRDLIPVTLASMFINVAAPGTGSALFVDDAARRGQNGARATAGLLLVRVADFATFFPILIAGMVYLLLHHDLKVYEVLTAAVLVAVTGGLTAVLLLGLWRATWVEGLLNTLQRFANAIGRRVGRHELLPETWAEDTAREFVQAAMAIFAHPDRLVNTVLIAACAHIIDLTSLYTLFLAFHRPVSPGVLIAGFAMGVLFWIVAITPQGIGVVEGMMALAYTSLGVSASRATVVTLAFRDLTFWLPLLGGFFVLRHVKSFGAGERPRSALTSVRVISLLTAAMGVINVISATLPSLRDRVALIASYLPLEVRRDSRLTAVLAGFALILLANGLWRRKRAAWSLTVVILVVSIFGHLIKGLDYEESLLAAGLLAWLIAERANFHARSDAPSVRQGLVTLVYAALFTLAYGVAGFYLLDRHFSVNFALTGAVRQTIVMFTEFYDPRLEPITEFGRYFANSIYLVGMFTTGYALMMIVRPVLLRRPAEEEERERARAIVEVHGRSPLARFTLLDDKAYYFSDGGSVISYVAKGRIALALSDPIGPDGDAAAAITGFREFCAQNDWKPAFYECGPGHLAIYREAGLVALHLGDEAILDVQTFSTTGKSGKSLRLYQNRFEKQGYRTEVHQPPLSVNMMRELREVSDEWLTAVHGNEKRFCLGWFDDDYIRNAPVMVLHAPDGAITAFANIVTEYQRNEITIDLMRRRSNAGTGTMEVLFLALFEWAKQEGYDSFNLGLSPLSGVGTSDDDPLVEQALHYIFDHINQFYNFKGLHDFKAKFHPRWEPRYLVYPGAASLPAVWIAIMRADSGDDFPWGYLKRDKPADAALRPAQPISVTSDDAAAELPQVTPGDRI